MKTRPALSLAALPGGGVWLWSARVRDDLATTPRWALWVPVVLFPLACVLVMVWWCQRPTLPSNYSL